MGQAAKTSDSLIKKENKISSVFSIDDIAEYSPDLYFKINTDKNPANFTFEQVQKGYYWSCDRRILTYCENADVKNYFRDLAALAKKEFAFLIKEKFPAAIMLLNFQSFPKITERSYDRQVNGNEIQRFSNYGFFYDLSGTILIPKKINGINPEKQIDSNVRTALKPANEIYKGDQTN